MTPFVDLKLISSSTIKICIQSQSHSFQYKVQLSSSRENLTM